MRAVCSRKKPSSRVLWIDSPRHSRVHQGFVLQVQALLGSWYAVSHLCSLVAAANLTCSQSATDNTVSSLLAAMGEFVTAKPPYGSAVIFEVWAPKQLPANTTREESLRLRIIYNDVIKHTIACESDFCPLVSWLEYVSQLRAIALTTLATRITLSLPSLVWWQLQRARELLDRGSAHRVCHNDNLGASVSTGVRDWNRCSGTRCRSVGRCRCVPLAETVRRIANASLPAYIACVVWAHTRCRANVYVASERSKNGTIRHPMRRIQSRCNLCESVAAVDSIVIAIAISIAIVKRHYHARLVRW